VADAALALEGEVDGVALDVDVAVAHGGETVGVVGVGVFLVADADEGGLHEADDGGEDFGARHVGEGEVVLDSLTDGGQSGAEEEHALVLGFVADLAPARVVAALLTALGIAAGGLEVSVGDGADPDLLPGGRDYEGLDAGDGFFVFDGFAAAGVVEAFAAAVAADSGFGVGDVAQACGFGGLCRVGDYFQFSSFPAPDSLHVWVGCRE
jgi:hypothetical protein